MPEDLADQIRESAASPKSASVDGVEMQQHSLKDQIEADRYLASKKAASSKGLGVRVSRMSPPGAV